MNITFNRTAQTLPGAAPLGLLMLDFVNEHTGDVFSLLVCTDASSPFSWWPINLK